MKQNSSGRPNSERLRVKETDREHKKERKQIVEIDMIWREKSNEPST